MSIPSTSLFPTGFDADENLYMVHDALRLQLSVDYNPGDTTISVQGDPAVLARWPQQGLLTMTEQCSDVALRALSCFYTGVDTVNNQFTGIEVHPDFVDSPKPKRITDVTLNVIKDHHNNLCNALMACQGFTGIEGTTDTAPFGSTLEGRINFLRKIVLRPYAWFAADKRTGIVPFDVTFENLSFRQGTDTLDGPITATWDFGDNTSSQALTTVTKTYINPGLYDVTLTITNAHGQDICKFQQFIQARLQAPNPAVVDIIQTAGQIVTAGSPVSGPYEVFPRIRSPINTLINLEVHLGENLATQITAMAENY